MDILEKFWDTVIINGLGGLLKPWQIKRVGLAEAMSQRKKMLIEAQTEIDIIKIKNGDLAINDKGEITENDDFIDVLIDDEKFQIIKRKTNLLKTLDKTISMIESNTDKCDESSEKPSDEWFDRWREYSEKANDEEVQDLWARILNQEIRYGGSISLRTLDFIRSISRDEAKLMEKVFSLSLTNMLIYYVSDKKSDWGGDNNPFLPKVGVTGKVLSELQYLKIIDGVDSMGVVLEIPSLSADKYVQNIIIGDYKITITNNKKSKVIIHAYQFTVLGLELMKILRLNKDIEYFNLLFSSLKDKGFEILIEQQT